MWRVFILGCMLMLGACNGGCKTNPTSDKVPSPKKLTLLLCTANVQFFQGVQPVDVLQTLAHLRQETDDIVFFGLQETKYEHLQTIQQALPEYQVYDHRKYKNEFSNTVLVYNRTNLKMECRGINLPHYMSEPFRYAIFANFSGINLKIANTHLMGGRFDDEQWYHYINGRQEQIKAILAHHPLIVMGDFNADNTPSANLGKYWQEKLNRGLENNATLAGNKEVAEQKLRHYIYSIHDELAQQQYVSLLKREDIGSTAAKGGGIVDWIYVSKELSFKVVDSGVIRAIDQHLSDHNFPWIRIEIEC